MTDRLSWTWRLRAALGILVIPVLLARVSLSRVAPRLGRSPRTPVGLLNDRRLAAWVSRRLRRLPDPWRYTCLRRSAVLYYLLRRAGRAVELCIGVRRDAERAFEAHAWLVLDGEPYLEPSQSEHAEYRVIARFPETGDPA